MQGSPLLILLQLVAVVPGLAILWYFYKRDVHEPEPMGDLAVAFGLGALSVVVALLAYWGLGMLGLPKVEDPWTLDGAVKLGSLVLKVGFVEEGAKLLVVLIFFYRSRQLNEPLDGVIYSATVAIGFATLENVFYTLAGGLKVGLARALTAVPGHAVFSALMGYGVGRAKFGGGSWLIPLGLVFAALAHAVYDFLALGLGKDLSIAVVSCSSFVLIFGIIVHFLMSHLADGSPFKALSQRFALTRNLGNGKYLMRCRQCDTVFQSALKPRILCHNTACMNIFESQSAPPTLPDASSEPK